MDGIIAGRVSIQVVLRTPELHSLNFLFLLSTVVIPSPGSVLPSDDPCTSKVLLSITVGLDPPAEGISHEHVYKFGQTHPFLPEESTDQGHALSISN
jgi:hypothetical protein